MCKAGLGHVVPQMLPSYAENRPGRFLTGQVLCLFLLKISRGSCYMKLLETWFSGSWGSSLHIWYWCCIAVACSLPWNHRHRSKCGYQLSVKVVISPHPLYLFRKGTWRQVRHTCMPISVRGFMILATDLKGKCQLVCRTHLGKLLFNILAQLTIIGAPATF